MLDFDGYGLISAIEQNFNPSKSDVERRTKQGYPRWMSGHLSDPTSLHKNHQQVLFPESVKTSPYTKTTAVKRYHLSFPSYPFRTLCSRELYRTKMLPSEFDVSSPLIPAHTQMHISIKRREPNATSGFLNQLLGYNLSDITGSGFDFLNPETRKTAVSFTRMMREVETPAADGVEAKYKTVSKDFEIKKVAVVLKNVKLLVSFFNFLRRGGTLSEP